VTENEPLKDFSSDAEDRPLPPETGDSELDDTQVADRKKEISDRDTEIFNRFLAGNDEAFRILYDCYERPLFLYVVKLLGTEADAQDIFQDIWVRMYRLRGERATVTKFSGLLFTIARNLSLNAIRDRKHLPDLSLEEVPPEVEASLRTMEFDEADIREMLQKALAQLPASQREAFILREYNGYSYQEIAEITGATMINVKTRAWRARERLRKVIAAWMDLKATE
jgi:RNA polymerase sigma-70 factor (ECF subfamily)